MLAYGTDEVILREGLGEIFIRADQAASSAVENAVLARQHDYGRAAKSRIPLDQRAGLISIETRHHDVNEYNVRVMFRDFRQCRKAVLRENHVVACLGKKEFGASPNGVAVVDHEDFDARMLRIDR